MRVLVVPHAPTVGIRTRAGELARALAGRGVTVDLYQRPPQPAGLSKPGKLAWHLGRLTQGGRREPRPDGPAVLTLPSAHRGGPVVRWAAGRAARLVRRAGYDVVFTAAYDGLFLPRGSAGMVVYDLVDDHPDGCRRAGLPAVAEAVDRFVRAQVAAADAVTVSGLVLGELAQSQFGRDAVYAPNGANVAAVRGAGPPEPGAERRIGYMGGLDEFVDIKFLVAAVAKLRAAGKPYELVVIGDGPAVRGWPVPDWVQRCGFRPPAEVPGLMRRFRVGTVPFHLSPFTDAALPLKVIEYGAARMRVVSSPLKELQLQRLPFADLVPLDVDRWAAALDAALSAPWPAWADEVVDGFDWGRAADRLLDVFRGAGGAR